MSVSSAWNTKSRKASYSVKKAIRMIQLWNFQVWTFRSGVSATGFKQGDHRDVSGTIVAAAR
jgi:hypothetical protein